MRVLKSDFAKYNVSDDDELLDDLGMSGLCKLSLCSIPFLVVTLNLCTYQCNAGGGRQGIGWGFDFFQKISIKFPA